MTIDKAIRRLGSYLKYRKPDPDDNFWQAIQLSREALIFYQTHKSRVIPPYTVLLPGEDPE